MSIEYYQTPTEKKEIVMYINPSKMSITTAKVKKKFIRVVEFIFIIMVMMFGL
jgi:hypothetical protein